MDSDLKKATCDVAVGCPDVFIEAVTRRLLKLPCGIGIHALIAAFEDMAADPRTDPAALASARSAAEAGLREAGDFRLGTKDLAQRYGVSPRTVWNTVRHQAGFPKPIRTSAGRTVWRLSEIAAWEAAQEEA